MGGASGCGHWMWSVGGGYNVYLIMEYPYTSCVCAFWQPHPQFPFNFCKLFFILVFVTFLDFSNLISERIIECFQHLVIRDVPQGQ